MTALSDDREYRCPECYKPVTLTHAPAARRRKRKSLRRRNGSTLGVYVPDLPPWRIDRHWDWMPGHACRMSGWHVNRHTLALINRSTP